MPIRQIFYKPTQRRQTTEIASFLKSELLNSKFMHARKLQQFLMNLQHFHYLKQGRAERTHLFHKRASEAPFCWVASLIWQPPLVALRINVCKYIINFQMGASQVNDHIQNDIQLYLVTSRNKYSAGDFVDGKVYLKTEIQIPQNSHISIAIQGREQAYWQERGRTHQNPQSQQEIYKYAQELHKFEKSQPAGSYAFPFELLLPSMMSGTLHAGPHNFIEYALMAELVNPQDNNNRCKIAIPLNILEKSRSVLKSLKTAQVVSQEPKGCFSWCHEQGTITFNLSCNKSSAKPGELIQVSGLLDLTKLPVKNVSYGVNFERMLRQVSKEGEQNRVVQCSDRITFVRDQKVPADRKVKFQVSYKIPQSLRHDTAIGSNISRTYCLKLFTGYGCEQIASTTLQLQVKCKQPTFEKRQRPLVLNKHEIHHFEPKAFRNLGLFVWQPDPMIWAIDFLRESSVSTQASTVFTVFMQRQMSLQNTKNADAMDSAKYFPAF